MAGSAKPNSVAETAARAVTDQKSDEDEQRRLAEKAARKAERRRQRAEADPEHAAVEAPPAPSSDLEMAGGDDEQRAKDKAARKAARRAEKERARAAAAQAEPEDNTSRKRKQSVEENNGTPQSEQDSADDKQLKRKQQKTIAVTEQKPPAPSGSTERTADFHREHKIGVKGSGAEDVHPIVEFSELAGYRVPEFVMPVLDAFQKPTPIQSQCWPAALVGRDVIGIAKTGSGKTLGFILPALVHLHKLKALPTKPKAKGPSVLVLAPTRELALQITEVAEAAGKICKMQSVCIFGGVDKGNQTRALRAGVDIVVATPGRLLGLVREGACNLSNVTYLVLDEADRMLDLGFEPDIRAIVAMVAPSPPTAPGPTRQTLLFSATWPEAIQKLGREFVHDAIHITIGIAFDSTGAEVKQHHPISNHDVSQAIEVIDDRARDQRLDTLLRDFHATRKNRIIIFVLYKKEAPRIESMLQRKGWKAVSIHGDKSQAERTRAFEEFKSGRQPLLVATDVAARGLNIPDVSHVINYSFPLTIEDYVHRIGRTGRAGNKGHAHTFFTRNDKGLAGSLVNVLNEAKQPVPKDLLAFGTAVKKKTHELYGAHFKDSSNGAPMKQATRITFSNNDDE